MYIIYKYYALVKKKCKKNEKNAINLKLFFRKIIENTVILYIAIQKTCSQIYTQRKIMT